MIKPGFRWKKWLIFDELTTGLVIETMCNGSTSVLETKPIWPSRAIHWMILLIVGTFKLERERNEAIKRALTTTMKTAKREKKKKKKKKQTKQSKSKPCSVLIEKLNIYSPSLTHCLSVSMLRTDARWSTCANSRQSISRNDWSSSNLCVCVHNR